MIYLDVHLDDLASELLRKYSHADYNLLGDGAFQMAKPLNSDLALRARISTLE